jgi:hypothetical protein
MTAPSEHQDRHRLSDQPPGDGIAVGVEIDRAIGLHLADEIPELAERRAATQGPERTRLRREARDRRLSGRAVHALVGDLPGPALEMRHECAPAREAAAGDRVALHIADAALVLTLGSRAIRRAGPGPEAQ